MPHLVLKDFQPPKPPATFEGMTLLFGSTGAQSGIAGVECDGKSFLLRWHPHAKGTILKVDKSTRPPQLNTVKAAMKAFAKASGCEVIYSTIETKQPDKTFEGLIEADHYFHHDPDRPLWVEVGFGSGRHMLHNAEQVPDKRHLGLEVHRPSAEQLLRRAEDGGFDNIQVACADARIVLQTLPSQSVERLFVHFPVPWDKAPNRRVFSKAFIESTLRILTPGGTLELRTDSREYFEYAFGLLCDLAHAELAVRKNHDAGIISKYEDRWRRQQKDIFDLIYTHRAIQPPDRPWYDFGFKPFSLETALGALEQKMGHAFVDQEALLKLRALWTLEDGTHLLQLTLGACDAPQTSFVRLSQEGAGYFPIAPLATQESHLAHNKLQEVLHGA